MMVAAFPVLGSCLVTPISLESHHHWIILHGDGYKPNPFGVPGMEKSSICIGVKTRVTLSRTEHTSSLKSIPDTGSMTSEPKT